MDALRDWGSLSLEEMILPIIKKQVEMEIV